MTIANALVQGGKVYLYADTAYIDTRTGNVIAFLPKIYAGSHFPWAVAVTTASGDPLDMAHAIETLDTARNVAGLLKALPRALRVYEERCFEKGNKDQGLRLLVGCWDTRRRAARLFVLTNMPDGVHDALGGEVGQVMEIFFFFGSHLTPEQLLGRVADPRNPAEFDADEDGLRVMEAARRQPIKAAVQSAGFAGYGIGGEAEQVIVSRRGVKSFSLQQWGDRVGERIDPFGGPGQAIPAAAMEH